jgi:Golgi apparatus protein 1
MNAYRTGPVFLSLAVLVGVVPAAQAHGGAMAACKEDARKLCGGVEPGEGRIRECMKAHEADLSDACKAAVAQAKAKWEPVKEACRADQEKLCPGLTAGKGLFQCMKAREADVSAACKAAVAPLKAEREERFARHVNFKQDCKADRERLCADTPRGPGAVRECMKAHEAELSAACKAHF